mmetsp:Transcript_100760/g.157350  ORF Transcript_100760/g.157350 Transcript_100760/m.157350 type:complete len:279 (-) Transcript_100760:16-852(-)
MRLVVTISLVMVGMASSKDVSLTLRSQYLSSIGRQEWIVNNTVVQWRGEETAIVVVDMWQQHWCPTATTRVAELAVPMNQTLTAARSFGVHVVFAPSDCTEFYKNDMVRKNVLALPKAAVPTSQKVSPPQMPLSTSTNAGCDVVAEQGHPWYRQIETLAIHDDDFLITAVEGQSEQELINVIRAKGIKNLIYMGVHENMCIVNRPFAIEKVISWGWSASNTAVVRELVDVMYTPVDSPYVSHAEGIALQTAWLEKHLVSSISMYDFLKPTYDNHKAVV